MNESTIGGCEATARIFHYKAILGGKLPPHSRISTKQLPAGLSTADTRIDSTSHPSPIVWHPSSIVRQTIPQCLSVTSPVE
jgi:hypothetical protein